MTLSSYVQTTETSCIVIPAPEKQLILTMKITMVGMFQPTGSNVGVIFMENPPEMPIRLPR